MTHHKETDPPAQSIAGGAKYHALKATAKWSEYVSAVQDVATRTAGERERRNRERVHAEEYRRKHPTP